MLSTSFTQHEVFNVGCGDETTLIEIIRLLEKFSNTKAILNHIKEREGDIKHSKANIDKIIELANYNPSVRINDGLKITFDWYQKNYEHRS
jgi:UDP-N-acetylglucosamine 4-epimerase